MTKEPEYESVFAVGRKAMQWVLENAPSSCDMEADGTCETCDAGGVCQMNMVYFARRHFEILDSTVAEQDEQINKLDERLVKAWDERDSAKDTLKSLFDQRKLMQEQYDQAVNGAVQSYLRTAKNGGAPEDLCDNVEAVINDMIRLSVFADLFVRVRRDSQAESDKLKALITYMEELAPRFVSDAREALKEAEHE